MKRIYFTLFGLALLVGLGVILVRFGGPGADPLTLAGVLGLFVAADLFILGGLRAEFRFDSLGVRWYHVVGTGVVLIGFAQAVFALGSAADAASPSIGVIGAGILGAVIVFVGIDLIRGGVYHDLSRVD